MFVNWWIVNKLMLLTVLSWVFLTNADSYMCKSFIGDVTIAVSQHLKIYCLKNIYI